MSTVLVDEKELVELVLRYCMLSAQSDKAKKEFVSEILNNVYKTGIVEGQRRAQGAGS